MPEDIELRRERARLYYLKNKEAIKAKTRAWQLANPEKKNANKRKNYWKNHERSKAKGREYAHRRSESGKRAEYQRLWRSRRRDHVNDLTRAHHIRGRENLSDSYIRQNLARNYGIKNPTKEQIEHRRAIIAAKRSTRHLKLLNTASELCKASPSQKSPPQP